MDYIKNYLTFHIACCIVFRVFNEAVMIWHLQKI